jgi:hypothetical protein
MSTAVIFSRESQCGRKEGYRSKSLAKRVARRTETHFRGGRLNVYACSWCSSPGDRIFHIGHRPAPEMIAAARSRRSEEAG